MAKKSWIFLHYKHILGFIVLTNSIFAAKWKYDANYDTYAHWLSLNPGYYINETGCADLPFDSIESTILAAFDVWNDVMPSTVQAGYIGSTNLGQSQGDYNSVLLWWDTGNPNNKKLAFSGIGWNAETGRIQDVDIIFFDHILWTMDSWVWDVEYDLKSVAVHEIGHFFGLMHTGKIGPQYGCPTMMDIIPWDDYCHNEAENLDMRNLVADDEYGLNFLYAPITSAPSNLSWTNYQGYVKLSWNANTEFNIHRYNIYRNAAGCGPNCGGYRLIATVDSSTTTYIDWDVRLVNPRFASNTVYYYVKSENPSEQESPKSNTVSVPTNYIEYQKALIEGIPVMYSLSPNHPNPFNPVTTIRYDLSEESFVEFKIFDLIGREIRTIVNGNVEAGYKNVVWDGTDNSGNAVSSGMYLYHIRVKSLESNKSFSKTRKMVLLR